MLKISDVLDPKVVQNFSSFFSQAEQFEQVLSQNLVSTSNTQVLNAISSFLNDYDDVEASTALDISVSDIQSLKNGVALQENHETHASKIIALILAMETDALTNLNIPNSLQDYPM